MLADVLRTHDAHVVELDCGPGSVLIPPALNGRLFCQLNGELIHRLDDAALRTPSPDGYDNLGGNSLWPAPEGGPFAFNYPPGSDDWYVQDGISRAVPSITRESATRAVVEKRISLVNRKGVRIALLYRRIVSVPEAPFHMPGYAAHGMLYETQDIFEPAGEYRADDVLIAPWSLEQFPGADGIVAFGKVTNSEDELNFDFYGDPGDRISWKPGTFRFRLGGRDRHQVGVRVKAEPQCIGALDPRRSLLFLRKTALQQGQYFNIADNEQAAGPFSAADLYSIFNGGELGFFELETIGAMQQANGLLTSSMLLSRTLILNGPLEELLRYLSEREDIPLEDVIPNSR